MAKNFFTKLTEWQNYVHYVLLAFGVYFWHMLPYNSVVEQGSVFGLIIWWAFGLFIIDTIIHGIFWYIPYKKLRWRD